jgi:hypothetical protein
MLDRLLSDIYLSITPYLDLVDQEFLRWSCQTAATALINSNIATRLRCHRTYVKLYYCPEIIQIMGGLRQMVRFPILSWKNRFWGDTRYIDNIQPDDMSNPVMLGTDTHQRPFIALRINGLSGNNDKPVVEILFQRFQDNPRKWVNGCDGYGLVRESGLWMNDIITHRYLTDNLTRLLNNQGYIMYEQPTSPYHLVRNTGVTLC